jgi:hypothetical protein
MLLGNYSPFNRLPLRARTGTTTAGASFAFSPGNYACPGWSHMIWQDGSNAALPEIGYPSGYYDRAFKMPLGLSSTSTKTQYISGMSALITINGGATGIRAVPGAGLSTITIDASGGGGLVVSGEGYSTFTINATADILAQILGIGSTTITISANADTLTALGWADGSATITIDGSATPRGIGWVEGTTDYSVAVTPESIAQATWEEEIENSYTAKEAIRIVLATLAGKVSGAGTSTITFRDINDSKDRLVADVDGTGNREAITIDVS